jgi:hypothetical protein
MAQAVITGLLPRRPVFAPASASVGFVVGKLALGQDFLRVLRFSFTVLFHHGCPYSYIIWRMNNRPVDGSSSETVSLHQHGHQQERGHCVALTGPDIRSSVQLIYTLHFNFMLGFNYWLTVTESLNGWLTQPQITIFEVHGVQLSSVLQLCRFLSLSGVSVRRGCNRAY